MVRFWGSVRKYVAILRVARGLDETHIPRLVKEEEKRRENILKTRAKPLCRNCEKQFEVANYCPVCLIPYSNDEFDVKVGLSFHLLLIEKPIFFGFLIFIFFFRW